jgi:3-phosphoshikimate 1-carboxyvinyltransferase
MSTGIIKKYVSISPQKLKGSLAIPPSKSICHRALICAGLSEGVSNIENITASMDVEATLNAMKKLGAEVSTKGNSVKIKGAKRIDIMDPYINCLESGSTLRFLIPIAATCGKSVTFEGGEGLAVRPLEPYYDIFDEKGIKYNNLHGKLPLTIDGQLKPGEYRIKGSISSQFISGLLLAAPLLDGDSKITITTKLESRPYVDLTIDMMKRYSVEVENHGYEKFFIKGNQKYRASDYTVESDFSQAAFFLAAGILGEEISCEGLNMNSLQGDKIIIDIIREMGGTIILKEDKVIACPSKTKGMIIDVRECPDLVPILAVLGALSEGTTEIISAGRLRLKESDRLSAISSVLNKLGADVEEKEDSLIIRGKDTLKGGTVDSFNDHRIAMAAAVASIKCSETVIIKDSDCVKKSYPEFWNHFKKLGGSVDEWSMGK